VSHCRLSANVKSNRQGCRQTKAATKWLSRDRRLRCIGLNNALAVVETWSWRTTNTASLFPACNVACAKTSTAPSSTLHKSAWSPFQSRRCPRPRRNGSAARCPKEVGITTGPSASRYSSHTHSTTEHDTRPIPAPNNPEPCEPTSTSEMVLAGLRDDILPNPLLLQGADISPRSLE